MVTVYPNQIDNNNSLPKVQDLVSPVRARDHNELQEAIVAIQTELGANPSGVLGTVKDRLENIIAGEVAVADIDGYYSSNNVEDILAEIGASTAIVSSGNIPIGDPEDATYNDGLFTDFTSSTRIGITIDRFNEVLKSLAPSPAPSLSDMSFTSGAGPAGNLSFGTSNAIVGYTNVGTDGGGSALDINGTFTSGGSSALRQGVFDNATVQSGVLADAVPADSGTPTPAYPANAFGDADQGTLELWVNGINVHSVDLSVFVSGSTLTSGSGFVLSAATDGYFPNGDSFDLFKNRTGTWQVDPTHQRNGYNYMQVIHDTGVSNTTNFFEWVVDDNTTAASFASESLSSFSGTGSKYISGVEHHTGGTASYGVTVSNLHRNTYSTSASAISHGSSTNVSIPSSSLGTISAESDTEVISKTATINATRILNGSITGNTTVDRTVQGDVTSSGSSISGLLVDNQSDNSTNTNEPLNGEQFRVASNKALTDTTGYNSGGNDALWDQTLSITTGGAGYNDGLLVHNGSLYYPNDASVANGGNFSTISNGPAGNPDYSSASGTRVYWRYFYFSSGTSNFTLNLNANGTVVNAGSVSSSTDEFSVEFLLPNTTVDGGATVEFKDANIAYTSDTAIGCYAATYGSNVGDVAGNDWGISFGTKSTATSGNAVVLRITAGDGWTGDVSNISLVAA